MPSKPNLTIRILQKIQTDLSELRGDVAALRGLPGEVSDLRGEVAELRGDVRGINTRLDDVLKLTGGYHRAIEQRVEALEHRMDRVESR